MPFQDLDREYPDLADTIVALRRDMPVFDEICRDYEALVAEANALPDPTSDPKWRACLDETLTDLRQEISSLLQKHAVQAAHQNDPMKNMSRNGDRDAP